MLFVSRLNNNFLSVLVMEGKGYEVMFRSRKVLIHPKDISPNIVVSIRVREGNLYRLKGKLV